MKKKELKEEVRNLKENNRKNQALARELDNENCQLKEEVRQLKEDVHSLSEIAAFYGTVSRVLGDNIPGSVYIKAINTDKRKKTTTITWTDDSTTTVKCGKEDTFDEQKGILYCIAKKVMTPPEYTALTSGNPVYKKGGRKLPVKIYLGLFSKNADERKKYQKSWEKIPGPVRQATKAFVNNVAEA